MYLILHICSPQLMTAIAHIVFVSHTPLFHKMYSRQSILGHIFAHKHLAKAIYHNKRLRMGGKKIRNEWAAGFISQVKNITKGEGAISMLVTGCYADILVVELVN